MVRKLSPADIKRIEWVKSFKAGKRWFDRLRARKGEKSGTQKNFSLAMERFCEFTGKNPDGIIEQYKEGINRNINETLEYWNEQLDLFIPWLVDTYSVRRSTAVTTLTGVKSFFKYNVAIRPSTPTPEFVTEEIPPINMEDLRSVLEQVNPYHRFQICFLKDSGISMADALRLTLGDLDAHKPITEQFLRIPADPRKKIIREKEAVKYETFIGPNAIEALKIYLKMRRNKGEELTAESPLFTTNKTPWRPIDENNLMSIFRWISKRTGITISSHRCRKFCETYLALARVNPIISKYWMGHKIRTAKTEIEGKYIIPPTKEQMSLYKTAYRFIDVTPKPVEEELVTQQITTILETLTPQQRREYVKKIPTLIPRKAHRILSDKHIQRLLKEKEEPVGGGLPVEPSFKQIRESEILPYLQNGWRIEYRMSNGNVIIRKG